MATGVCVLRVRYMLTLSSYRSVLTSIERTRKAKNQRKQYDPKLLVWSVTHAAKLVPGASCLTQALSLRWLLAKSGQDCTIRIGVHKSAKGAVEAHAWVIKDGEILIGGVNSEPSKFVPIVDL